MLIRVPSVQKAIFPDACANCFSQSELLPIESRLVLSRFLLLGAIELTQWANIPHCPDCTETASRTRHGLGMTFLLLLVLSVLCALLPAGASILVHPERSFDVYLWAGPFVALIAMVVWYSTRKAAPGQTSYYQAVSLRAMKRKFSGEVVHCTLSFTNSDYGQLFLASNPDAKKLD